MEQCLEVVKLLRSLLLAMNGAVDHLGCLALSCLLLLAETLAGDFNSGWHWLQEADVVDAVLDRVSLRLEAVVEAVDQRVGIHAIGR